MASVASGGATDRIVARTLFKVLRAGSGTPARYSSMPFGAALPFMPEPRLPDFTFLIQLSPGRSFKLNNLTKLPRRPSTRNVVVLGSASAVGRLMLVVSAYFMHIDGRLGRRPRTGWRAKVPPGTIDFPTGRAVFLREQKRRRVAGPATQRDLASQDTSDYSNVLYTLVNHL